MAKPEQKLTKRAKWQRVDRARDFIVLVTGAMAVLVILAVSGALGWIEVLTASIVIGAGALAFFAGTTSATDLAGSAHDRLDDGAALKPGLQDVLEALPLPTMLIDRDGRIDVINDRARKVFRIQLETGGLATTAIRHPELLSAIEQVSAGHEVESIELVFPREIDEVWKAQVVDLPLTGDILVVLKDRTAVRRAEKARADFLANASHELRTPLTSIAGFIETMRGPGKDDKASWDEFLEIMQSQTDRMQRLIHDLLSLSRIELSELKLPREVVDLATITAETVESLRPVAVDQGVSIRLTGPAKGLSVIAVRDELAQTIQNLVDNARKYSPKEGTISVSLGTATSEEEAHALASRQWREAEKMMLLSPKKTTQDAWTWVRVEDQGVGIARQFLPRLGERFYRVDESRGGSVEGTGLGLAIVKHIMTRHKGGFAVESIVDEGSAFGIWLPIAD